MYNKFYIDSANLTNVDLDTITSPGIITASYLLVTDSGISFAPIPFALLQLTAIQDTPARFILDTCNNASDGFGSSIRGRRIRGTYDNPQAVQHDDIFLQVTCDAYDGNILSSNNCVMLYRSAENWTTSSHGAYIEFRTTAVGQISNSVSLKIDSDGFTYGNFSGNLTGTASYATSASWAPYSTIPHTEKGIISGSDFVGSPRHYDIIYNNPFENDSYIVSVIGDDARVWSTANRSATGFTINSNSNAPINGMVMWRVEKI